MVQILKFSQAKPEKTLRKQVCSPLAPAARGRSLLFAENLMKLFMTHNHLGKDFLLFHACDHGICVQILKVLPFKSALFRNECGNGEKINLHRNKMRIAISKTKTFAHRFRFSVRKGRKSVKGDA